MRLCILTVQSFTHSQPIAWTVSCPKAFQVLLRTVPENDLRCCRPTVRSCLTGFFFVGEGTML